jgi:CDP-diacylglycerol--serine O-phosphatidyltransferase
LNRQEAGAQVKKIFIAPFGIADAITLFGVLCAAAACHFAHILNYKAAMILFIISGICDMFDGYIARRVKHDPFSKEFGIRLDAAADVASFVVAPPIIVYVLGPKNVFTHTIYVAYMFAGIVRLAYFSAVTTVEAPTTSYRGLPVTSSAFILPTVSLLTIRYHLILLPAYAMAVMALLFVLNIPVPKLKGAWYAVSSLAAALMIFGWIMV